MNNRERVRIALSHKLPDRVPYHIDFTIPAYKKMAEYFGNPDFAKSLGNCLYGVSCSPRDSWKEVEPDIWQDEFGVIWNRTVDKDIGVVCNRLVTEENAGYFPMPDPENPDRFREFETAVNANDGRFLVANIGFSFFERAWTLFGMENLLTAMVAEKETTHALFDRILEFNLKVIEKACSYDIDAVLFGDDWGQQRGLITGPELWREFIKPGIAKMYNAVKKTGKFVFIHSCGKIDEIIPELIEIGVDVFNPFQPEVTDVFGAKRKYGERLSFYGGISTQRTLPFGSIQDVREEVKRLIHEIGEGGGYIAAPAHAIPADARAENIAVMIEVLQNQ